MAKEQIRSSIIPDASVKLLDLYFDIEEQEIFAPTTQRKEKSEDTEKSILQEIIQDRIDDEIKHLPLVLRKRKLYENAIINNSIKPEEIELARIASNGIVPIMLRKYLLLKQARAS